MRREMTRKPTHPGEMLKAHYLEPTKTTISALADRIGVSRKTLSAIVNERAGITPEMAVRLSRALNTTAELWLNMQSKFDLWVLVNTPGDWEQIQPLPLDNSSQDHSM